MKLRNKIIVITGASQGLGEAIARKVAIEGATVILIARSTQKLKHIEQEIINSGGNAKAFVCDIREVDQIRKTVAMILKKYKTIDVLINNAGIWTDNKIEENFPKKRKEAFDINALGNIQVTYEILPIMKEKNSGQIVNVVSTSGIEDTTARDNSHWQTYGATKWAMTGFTNALRDSLIDSSIKVIGFFPGGFDSNLYQNGGRSDSHGQMWMMKVEDVADIILFAITRPNDILLEKIVVTKKFHRTKHE